MSLLILALAISCRGFMYYNLSQPRSDVFASHDWCTLNFKDDHYDWPANQPYSSYNRVFFPIHTDTKNFQITACDANGTQITKSAYVGEAYFLRDYVYVSLEYWSGTCKLFYAGSILCQPKIFYGRDLY